LIGNIRKTFVIALGVLTAFFSLTCDRKQQQLLAQAFGKLKLVQPLRWKRKKDGK